MCGPLNFGNMHLDGLLNTNVARTSKPGLISVDLICKKDVYMSALVSWHFHGSFYKCYACFCFSIALVIVR